MGARDTCDKTSIGKIPLAGRSISGFGIVERRGCKFPSSSVICATVSVLLDSFNSRFGVFISGSATRREVRELGLYCL